MAFGRGSSGSYVDNGTQSRTAVSKESKNNKHYWEVGFSDRETKRSYTVRIFTGEGSTYVPQNSKKSWRNGKTCAPCIINCSIYKGKAM